MYKKTFAFLFLFFSPVIHAGFGVDEVMDSVKVAKAETQQVMMDEQEIKKHPYTIQVASYINEKDAVSHVDELKGKEKDVMYFPTFVRGQIWFKVCVGAFDKKDKAEEFRKTFSKRMDEPFAVVISLLDGPENETRVNPATVAEVKAQAQEHERKPASSETATHEAEHKPAATEVKAHDQVRDPADIAKKSSTGVPYGTVASSTPTAAEPEVRLIPKSTAHAEHGSGPIIQRGSPHMKKEASHAPAHEPTGTAHGTAEHAAVTHASTEPKTHEMPKTVGAALSADKIYSVQIAAYPNESLAKESLSTLQLKGVDAYYQTAMVNGKQWYRVLVGKFKTKHEAEAYQKDFRDQMKHQESFVRRVTASVE